LKIMLHRLTVLVSLLLLTGGCTATRAVSSPPPATVEETQPSQGEATPTATPETENPPETVETAAGENLPADENAEEKKDYDNIQQDALDLCQSAADALDHGEIDEAIDTLDHAYELMLSLPANHEEEYLQAREDIRRLIADLILRAYSAPGAAESPTHSFDLGLTLVENEQVQREIRSFSGPEKQHFLAAYKRSGRYRPMILRKLEEAGLPSQLSWLPLVESGFKVKAYSRASALGLWQFIASTGQRYGLTRNGYIDERMDPEKATDAAIAYLSDLHDLFGDWPKALAAYNCGEARVARLQRSHPNEYLDFWDLYNLLPAETRRYVPRFFATLMIVEHPEKYGFELPQPDPSLDNWVHVSIQKAIKLETLDAALGLPKGALQELNPELRAHATPKTLYELKVPAGYEDKVVEKIASIPEYKPPTPAYLVHRVRRGETLSGIARRYHSSVRGIMRANNLRSANRIRPGQRLKIPVRGGGSRHVSAAPTYNPVNGLHTVRPGESLYSIARRYRTTVERLKRDNKLRSNTIHPGQKLKVAAGAKGRRYTVRKGDTLSGIAKAHGVRLSTLLHANGLSTRSRIYPGQVLVIP